jgi:hypothetical protein
MIQLKPERAGLGRPDFAAGQVTRLSYHRADCHARRLRGLRLALLEKYVRRNGERIR